MEQTSQTEKKEEEKPNTLKKCLKCGNENNLNNTTQGSNEVSSFQCTVCIADNCLRCCKIHSISTTCSQFEFDDKHWFRKKWTTNSDDFSLHSIEKSSEEWNIVKDLLKYDENKIEKIERVEHKKKYGIFFHFIV